MKECYNCSAWDSDYNCCTIPSIDRWYNCPIEADTPEHQKEMERYIEWVNKNTRER